LGGGDSDGCLLPLPFEVDWFGQYQLATKRSGKNEPAKGKRKISPREGRRANDEKAHAEALHIGLMAGVYSVDDAIRWAE